MSFRTEENVEPDLLQLAAGDAVLDRTTGELLYRPPGAESVGVVVGAPRVLAVKVLDDRSAFVLWNTTTRDLSAFTGSDAGMAGVYSFTQLQASSSLMLLSAVVGGTAPARSHVVEGTGGQFEGLFWPVVTLFNVSTAADLPVGGWLTLTWLDAGGKG